jgi:hypothetical protein
MKTVQKRGKKGVKILPKTVALPLSYSGEGGIVSRGLQKSVRQVLPSSGRLPHRGCRGPSLGQRGARPQAGRFDLRGVPNNPKA